MGSEMGPMSGPGTTSYRLPIVTIGLSIIVFALRSALHVLETDGQTDGIGLRIDGTMHRPSKNRRIETATAIRVECRELGLGNTVDIENF